MNIFLSISGIYKKSMEYKDLISFLSKYTFEDQDAELTEDETASSAGSATGGGGYPTVTKWETGLTRSVANQIDYKVKWKDLYKITRGKANTLL